MNYDVKDSGKRETFAGGMVRDTTEGKTNYLLVRDGPMLARWSEHLTKGAIKYEARNWMKADGPEELERFRSSAARHFEQWLAGDTDEDHAAAVFFNINGAEYTKDNQATTTTDENSCCIACGSDCCFDYNVAGELICTNTGRKVAL